MAGAGYKLFNTGDVLTAAQVNTYLMEQSVMVFANAAARTTALSGVVAEGMLSYLKDTDAVEVYNGSAWVASDDPNAIQNTIVDAKGDLISATANDTPARLAIGNNGETLVADSSATTGLRYTAGNAVGNPVLNSAFQIWQRGTSFSDAGSLLYTADRWTFFRALTGTSTVSRQNTNDTTNLPSIQYCARVQRNSGNTATNVLYLTQNFETVNTIPYVGKTITFSFYARAGANYSGASNNLDYYLKTGTGTDQNWISSYTGSANAIYNGATLTTTWQRFSATVTIATTVTEMAVGWTFTPTGTAGANDWFEVTGVQIDLGSTALPFRTYSATLAGELVAAQRYYYRTTADATFDKYGWAHAAGTTSTLGMVQFPVRMRVTPTALDYASIDMYLWGTGGYTPTAVTLNSESTPNLAVIESTGMTGLTQNRMYAISAGASTSYLGFSAEL